MQLNQLRYFLEIAKTKNISTAAAQLYLSQPALSQQIQKLEQELGIPLLIRHAKSVTLTDAGEQFQLHAERILNASDQLVDLMQKHSQLLSGTLKLGMPVISGYLGLFHLMKRYHDAMPGIRYQMTLQMSDVLLNLLKSRAIHAAFLISTDQSLEKQEELFFRKITQDEYVALVPAEHPLAEKEILETADFSEQNVIMPSRDSIFFRQLELLFQTGGAHPYILCETSQTHIVSQLTDLGLGIGFASDSVARSVHTDRVRIIPMADKIFRTIYYVTLKELLDYPSVHSFSSYVEHYVFDR